MSTEKGGGLKQGVHSGRRAVIEHEKSVIWGGQDTIFLVQWIEKSQNIPKMLYKVVIIFCTPKATNCFSKSNMLFLVQLVVFSADRD